MLFNSSLLAALAAQLLCAVAQDAGTSPVDAAQLNADVSATFPEADVLGVKLVNNHPTKALITVVNKEAAPIRVAFLSGNLKTTKEPVAGAPAYKSILRNLTAVPYDLEVPAGETKEVPYSFAQDMNPQDVLVSLSVVLANAEGNIFSLPAYSGTAAIVEAPTNIFDPQIIFLYIILTATLGGIGYFVYKTYIEALFPQAKRPKTPRAKSARQSDADAVDPASPSVAAASGASTINEDWIPEHHLNRPAAKRVKSGASAKSKKVIG